MVRSVIDLPEDLHERIDALAKMRGISFGEYVRELVTQQVGNGKTGDPMLDDDYTFDGAPPDVSSHVDKYLDEGR